MRISTTRSKAAATAALLRVKDLSEPRRTDDKSPVRRLVRDARRHVPVRDIKALAGVLNEEIGGHKSIFTLEVLGDAATLLGLAQDAHTLAELRCNGVPRRQPHANGGTFVGPSWIDVDEEAAEAIESELLRCGLEIVRKYGGHALHVGGDPRGSCYRAEFKSGRRNGWGDGFHIGIGE